MWSNLADELNVFSLDVLDDHDLHLGQEVQRQITHRIPSRWQCSMVTKLEKNFMNLSDFSREINLLFHRSLQQKVIVTTEIWDSTVSFLSVVWGITLVTANVFLNSFAAVFSTSGDTFCLLQFSLKLHRIPNNSPSSRSAENYLSIPKAVCTTTS